MHNTPHTHLHVTQLGSRGDSHHAPLIASCHLPWYIRNAKLSLLGALEATSQETISALVKSAPASLSTPHIYFWFLIPFLLSSVFHQSPMKNSSYQY